MIIEKAYKNFIDENPKYERDGLYSDFDSEILYSIIRHLKPKTILDFAPREGKTTSSMILAIQNNLIEYPNLKIKYYIFERDVLFLNSIREYTNQFTNIEFYYYENIIDNIDNIKNVKFDFLFIDANHDYILSKWYIDEIFPLMSKDAFIHIHDIYFDLHDNGWESVGLSVNPNTNEDIVSIGRLRELYNEELINKYELDGEIKIYEEDVIKNWFLYQQKKFLVESTITLSKLLSKYNTFNCACYFFNKKSYN